MNMLEIINPFCSEDETRLTLMEPYTRDGFTWATDGRALVRVPVIPEVEEKPIAPNAAAVFATYTPLETRAITEELPPPWPDDLKCDQCAGEGIVRCPHCHGSEQCNRCDGSGCDDFDARWMRIQGFPFRCEYVLKIAKLPRVKIAAGVQQLASATRGYLYFTFDGEGCGVCLALDYGDGAEKDQPHNEWKPEAALIS